MEQMVGAALKRAINAVIIGPIDCGARHQPYIGQTCKLLPERLRPIRPRLLINLEGFAVEPPPPSEIFICQDNLCPAERGSARSGQTTGTCADDQKITMQKPFVINVWIVFQRQAAQASRRANGWFIQFFPCKFGPHEGFIIESGA